MNDLSLFYLQRWRKPLFTVGGMMNCFPRQNTWMGQFDSPPDTQSLYFLKSSSRCEKFLTAAEALPVLTDADRIYDVEVCPVLGWLQWFCCFWDVQVTQLGQLEFNWTQTGNKGKPRLLLGGGHIQGKP